MNEFSAWIEYAAWAAGALVAVFAGGLWQRRQRRVVRGLQTALASQGERLLALERDLVALLSCSRGIAERLTKSETQQRRVQSELDKLHSADDNQMAVTHAMKLLNSGVDLQNVSDLCELSEGEVEILQNLARHRQAA
jgi:Protein of unknown function (DUF2802)